MTAHGAAAGSEVTFPLECPSCAAAAGHPVSVSSSGSQHVEVQVRCFTCAHVWTYLRASASMRI